MNSLNCLSINKSQILASALPNNSSSPSLPHRHSPHTSNPTAKVKSSDSPLPKLQQPKQLGKPNKRRQLSVLEIERAIGAGIFRDRDDDRQVSLNLIIYFLKF